MFSQTVNELNSLKAWWTIPMPCAIASSRRAEADRRAAQPDLAFVRPLQPIEDLISVDLPAPFSPITAWISPRSTERST